MRFRLSVIIFMLLSVILAACSSGDDNQAVPTVMQLPTIEEQDNASVEQNEMPTDEPPTATVAPTATPEPAETEEASPTMEEATEEVVSNQQTSQDVPSFILNSASGTDNNSLPPFMQGGDNAQQTVADNSWEIAGLEPVSAYECADSSCDVVATLQPGDMVEVLDTGDEWYNILVDEQSAFVAAEFVIPVGSSNPFAPPPGASDGSSGPPVDAPDFGGTGADTLPPGVQPGSFTTPAAPAPPGS